MFLCICFADIQDLSPDKQAQLKLFYAKLTSQPNNPNSADNKGSDKALATGSDTKKATDSGAKTPNKNSTATTTSDHCAPLNQLGDVATDLKLAADVKKEVTTATNTASHTSTSNKRNVKVSKKKESEPSKKEKKSPNQSNKPNQDDNAVAKTVALPVKKESEPSKKEKKSPNQSRKPNSTGGMRCRNQDDNAVAKTVAPPENANSTSVSHKKIHTPNISSKSESSDEDNGESNVKIPYLIANGKWDYITCDITKVKKADKADDVFEVPLQIQTCYQRDGQYQGDVIQETSEFVFFDIFCLLTYLTFFCYPF